MAWKLIKSITKVVDVITPPPPEEKGKIIVKSSVDGTEVSGFEVYINGEYKGTTPLTIEVSPGTYEVVVKPSGVYSGQVEPSEYRTSVSVGSGETKYVSATFQGVNPPEEKKGYLTVRAYVDSTEANFPVYVDGTNIGTTPVIGYELNVGTYTVKVVGQDTIPQEYTETVTILEGQTSTVEARFQPAEQPPSPGTLIVRSYVDDTEVSGFTVEIDGIQGTTPFESTINPGTYTVRVIPSSGYDVEPGIYEEVVTIGPGDRKEVEAKFNSVTPPPTPPKPPEGKGVIQVVSYLNDRPVKGYKVEIIAEDGTVTRGETPYQGIFDPGTYEIKVIAPKGVYPAMFDQTFVLREGETLTVEAKFSSKKPVVPTWTYWIPVGIGIGAVAYYVIRKKIL